MLESTTEFKDILKSIVTLGIPPGASSVKKIDVGTEEFLHFFEHEIIDSNARKYRLLKEKLPLSKGKEEDEVPEQE